MTNKYKLDKSFVDDHLQSGLNSMAFGIPIRDLSRDEIIALYVMQGNMMRSMREDHERQMDLLG